MRAVILSRKPSQAKAYADTFPVCKFRGYMEIQECPIFPEGAILREYRPFGGAEGASYV